MGKGEVQKGFVVILLLILGAAVLVSYLNNDGTGYASSRLRGSSGIDSPTGDTCRCSSKDPPLPPETTPYKCPSTGLMGTKTCIYKCILGLDSCTKDWIIMSSTAVDARNIRIVEEKLNDGNLQIQSCTTNCNRK